ncbi:YigZ family protein [Ructibacterium gallinarum]|uniref:YigZ family protein n=1 Tax=Ructibacterium gallinarum TaxID=2779355 RepID=A0A9D5RA58_9FIRM|nr:YigZ family protein [Ructibacterium gallinarum]MBE5041169.1 YigZ family protein [Ructibacterium gallinarum]
MANIYTTAVKEAEAELVVKRSRFLAAVKPVTTEKDALIFLDKIRQKHWNASHNVYAYILRENNLMRYSDDGEPGGTAGMPVLDMMKKSGLTDLIIVVTRYFGGVLLGTGGLVHAYSAAAKAGVEAAGIVDMVLCREITLQCEYTLLGKLQNEISKWKEVISGEAIYTERVELPLYLPVDLAEQFCTAITEKMNAKVLIKTGGTMFYPSKR